MRHTDTNASYFHKVVDCQWACPAHTPVPEYIRLISQGRYTEAYMVNWYSNLFPGILGRVCDRPCEPACRRGRVDEEPVAICRLKRVTADYKDENAIAALLPPLAEKKNGKRIALVGAGPASLTVASDLLPLGYHITLFERESRAGGAMFTQVPRFRLPTRVLDEEVNRILDRGVECHFNHEVKSLQSLLDEKFDAIFVATGAPVGRDLRIAGRDEAGDRVLVGVDFLASVSFGHRNTLAPRVIVIGGGNTAMDCARTAFRLGAQSVNVVAPETFEEMLASPWEKDDAELEGVHFDNLLLPQEFICKGGKLSGVRFQRLKQAYDSNKRWSPIPSGVEDHVLECDIVILAIGQNLAFPFLDKNLGIEHRKDAQGRDLPQVVVDEKTLQSQNPQIFFGGDIAFGPKNIIWAVAHGHEAAISIDLFCHGKNLHSERPQAGMNLHSRRIGLNQWSYDNGYSEDSRKKVPHHPVPACKSQLNLEVELGFDPNHAWEEGRRCLNCDVQTVFTPSLCIECDACVDICPVGCLTLAPDVEDTEALKRSLKVYPKNPQQALFLETVPQTKRLMVKDENFCLHCGLCAERCPTAAWDMKSFSLHKSIIPSEICIT